MFSVIIPTFNSSAHVAKAIMSVIDQTFDRFEVIVVDDGSDDDTFNVISQITDPRVKYFFKENGGPASARNFGIDKAEFEYLCFLDADDTFLPAKLHQVYQLIDINSKIDLIFTDALYINNDNATQFRFYEGEPIYSGQVFGQLIQGNFIVNSTVVLRKSTLELLDIRFDENNHMKFVEDYDLWLKLAFNKAEFYYLDEVLTNYHIHSTNNSRNAIRTYRSLIKIYKKYLLKTPQVVKPLIGSYLRLCKLLLQKT